MAQRSRPKPFRSARQEASIAAALKGTPQTRSKSYRLAFADPAFILADELRPVRLQLELLKPEMAFRAHGVEATVVVFGSARLVDPAKAKAAAVKAAKRASAKPRNRSVARDAAIAARLADNARYYDEARRFARLVSEAKLGDGRLDGVEVDERPASRPHPIHQLAPVRDRPHLVVGKHHTDHRHIRTIP